jgi:hypothetical protein
MLYPNRLQACLLFERPMRELDAIMRDFTRIEGMRSGAQFNVPEANEGRFYRLFSGAEELMVTLEYLDVPAVAQVFHSALSSHYTGIVTPDIRDRLARMQSHILIEVSHGVMAGVDEDPKFAALFEAIGKPRSGATQAQFERRLAVLSLLTRIATDHAMPLAVHWTQSDVLLSGELFDGLAASDSAPGPLHIHPLLFGPPNGMGLVGIRTVGAQHWLGREIIVQPSVLPWAANFETILAFLKVATMPGGYVIPDGDTFGPEDRSLSYRVLHHDAGANIGYAEPEIADIPFYELVPLKHVAHGFVAPDHVPDEKAFDDRAFPAAIMPEDDEVRMALANEWSAKRKLAEGIGGRFEVRHPDAPTAPPPPPVVAPTPSQPGLPSLSGRGLRSRVFGRKEQ